MRNNTIGSTLPSLSSLHFVRRNTRQGGMDTMDGPYSTTCSYHVLETVNATRSISKRSHPHFSITDATVISPSCLFASHLATSRMSWLSYVDGSSIHPAGKNLASTDCHFLALHSRSSQASFETPSVSLNAEMRLPATNSFIGGKRLLSLSEGALTALRKSLKKGMVLHVRTLETLSKTPMRWMYGSNSDPK